MGDHNFQQINPVYGFSHMAVNGLDVEGNQEIFLRQPDGTYLSLGTRNQAEARTLPVPLIGGPPANLVLGFLGTPQIDNNLFIRIGHDAAVGVDPDAAVGLAPDIAVHGMAPDAGGRARRSRKYRRSRKSRRSRKH